MSQVAAARVLAKFLIFTQARSDRERGLDKSHILRQPKEYENLNVANQSVAKIHWSQE